MPSRGPVPAPKRLVQYCGADCSSCEAYKHFLVGDESRLMNPETGYRCCWLPDSYPKGSDCEIKTCCLEKGVMYCGECHQFEGCERMKKFYSQPGYDVLKCRMLKLCRMG